MTPAEIVAEIRKLPIRDWNSIKDEVQDGLSKFVPGGPMTEEELNQLLYAKGIIGNIPDLSKYTDEDEDWEPIEIPGRPTSELIIEDRR